jgi:hypothetical protein
VEENDDVVKVEMGKPPSVKLVHAATGLTPRFENGAVNHVAGWCTCRFGVACVSHGVCINVCLSCCVVLCWNARASIDAIVTTSGQASRRQGGTPTVNKPQVHGLCASHAFR